MVVNHVSFLDGALLMAALDELPAFAVNTAMANRWWLKPFRRVANIYPLDPTNPLAIKDLIGKINAGQPCVIFPEGRLSVTGALMKIYAGPAYIADRTGATIVPVRLDGPELTPFTRLKARARSPGTGSPRSPSPSARRASLTVDPALRGKARRQIANLQLYEIMSDMVFSTTDWGPTLFEALLRARGRHGWRFPMLEDTSGVHLDYIKLVAGALVLGRRFAALTEPGERVGVLVPNVNAAVVFSALQAFGRVPAMLNFSAGPANLEAAVVTAQIKLVVSSGEFVAKAKLEPVDRRASAATPSSFGSRSCAARSAPGQRLAASGTACSRAASMPASACAATIRRWCCSPRARRAGPRASCSATAIS